MLRNSKGVLLLLLDTESLNAGSYAKLYANFLRLEADSLPTFSGGSFSSRKHFML